MTGLQISTLEFLGFASITGTNYQLVPENLSFNYHLDGDVRTLSSGYSPPPSMGFLFVPTLDGACPDASYLPENVTRLSDLPLSPPKIAIAPWISPQCTLAYLNAVSSQLVTAFVFFLPDQPSSSPLPSDNDAAWSLGDGGQWKTTYSYPVYAIPTQIGQMLLENMSDYSSNITDVPNGQQLVDDLGYPLDSYVRLLMEVTTKSKGGTSLPSIWVFLLIILAILLGLIGILSLTMHIIQRKRRNALQARIARGEVDVEALGIGKLTVPQDFVDKMPLYAYAPSPDPAVAEKGTSQASPPLQQSTCAICLDDFIPSESQVRELPCRHVFHPECIDLFLLDSSSFCPLCKQSVLPQGYIPGKITNSMVRRERYMRRNRDRRARQAEAHQSAPPTSIQNRVSSMFSRQPRAQTEEAVPPSSQVEMTSIQNQTTPPTAHGRREWAQRRALAMSGLRASSHEGEQEQERPTTSRSRKLLRNIFPGI